MRPVSCGSSFSAFNAMGAVVFHLVEDTPTTRSSAEVVFVFTGGHSKIIYNSLLLTR